MDVELNIERLLLDGLNLAPGERAVLVRALQAELARLITTHGIATQLAPDATLARVRPAAVVLATPIDALEAGTQIAAAAYSGLSATTGDRGAP